MRVRRRVSPAKTNSESESVICRLWWNGLNTEGIIMKLPEVVSSRIASQDDGHHSFTKRVVPACIAAGINTPLVMLSHARDPFSKGGMR
jgi:hypothetical protein